MIPISKKTGPLVGPVNIRYRLNGLIYQFVHAAQTGQILTKDGNRFKPRSTDGHLALARYIREYEKHIGKNVQLDEIGVAWVHKFAAWITGQDLAKNTVANLMAKLKSIIRRAHSAGLTPYSGMGMPISKELTTAVFSSIEEIKALHRLDCSWNYGRERVKDLYVLNCFAGMRIMDLLDFAADPRSYIHMMDGVTVIRYISRKTQSEAVIPLSKIGAEILDRRNWDFGKKFSYQVFNKHIKKAFREAGVTENIRMVRTVGGVRKETVRAKCELISSHTARRTFATLVELHDLQRSSIMQMTGHMTESSYLTYVRNTPSQNAMKVAKHDFFHLKL